MGKIKLHSIERNILLNAFKKGLDENFSKEELKILQRLKQRGIIKGKRFAVNYNALGFKQGFLFASIEHSGLDFPKFMEDVLALKNVSGVYFLTGEYDIAVSIFAKKLQSINNVALEIEQMFADYIERTNPIFVFKTYKREFLELRNSKKQELDETARQILLQRIVKPNAKIKEIAGAIAIHRNTASKNSSSES